MPKPVAKSAGKPASAISSKTKAKPAARRGKPALAATKAKPPAKAGKPAAKPASRPAAKPASKPTSKLASKSVANGKLNGHAPAKALKPLPPSSAASNTKSRQLAVSTKSGIEVKTKPAEASPQRASTPMKAKASQSTIVLPDNYQPSDAEPFMNAMQRLYFKLKLLSWKEDIVRQTRETLQGMVDDTLQHADLADRATSETDRALELRARDRQRKLIAKIDAALARIEDGTYGYCEETGEPIGLKRLDARPIATMSLEAQERHERRERVHRGD